MIQTTILVKSVILKILSLEIMCEMQIPTQDYVY